jgi:hypothetical protein
MLTAARPTEICAPFGAEWQSKGRPKRDRQLHALATRSGEKALRKLVALTDSDDGCAGSRYRWTEVFTRSQIGHSLRIGAFMPGERYGGAVVLAPLEFQSKGSTPYTVIVEFAGEEHMFAVTHVSG